MTTTLRLQFTDLVAEAVAGKFNPVVGRELELRRIRRTLARRSHHHVVVTGPPGVGKTALIDGFVALLVQKPASIPLPVIRLNTAQCAELLYRSSLPSAAQRIKRALRTLPPAIVVLDELGLLFAEPEAEPAIVETFLEPFFERSDLRLLATMTDAEARAAIEGKSRLEKHLELLSLAPPSLDDCVAILRARAPLFARQYRIQVPAAVLAEAAEAALHTPRGRALPDRALQLADEACAACVVRGAPALTSDDVRAVAAERVGLSSTVPSAPEHERIGNLTQTLRGALIGQDRAVTLVSDTIKRSWLGLRNPSHPHGAFLFLGPSGVGKTECARVVAREVFGSEQAFTRLDLSEFQESHTVQRLTGAPPGYVGHEAGGQLTNAVAIRPFSLLLLDELEKAHRSMHDLFLQILDDGRLTDGKGQTADFTHTIIIATSNLAALQIADAAAQGVDVTAPAFLERAIMPLLLERLRPEFLNRFDAVVVFQPLTKDHLVEIASLELRKLEQRLVRHHVRFRVSKEALRTKVTELYDLRFGARPLKRFLETLAERAVAEKLLTASLPKTHA